MTRKELAKITDMSKSKRTKNKFPKHEVFSSAGTAKYIGKNIIGPAKIRLVDYSTESVIITDNPQIDGIKGLFNRNMNHWVDLEGIHDIDSVEHLGRIFDLHPLMLEDILNTTQKPKLDYYDKGGQIFMIVKIPFRNPETSEIETEHVALVLGQDFAISFQELDYYNFFEPILARMNRENSKTKRNKLDYLFYSFIDIAVDNFYIILSQIEDQLEDLSNQILLNAQQVHQNELFFLKREIAGLRKILTPLKDILNQLLRDSSGFIKEETKIYLKDVQDHVLENLETIESFRDEAESLLVNYHSQLSNRMNSVMKTLTVFTAIFMPLTFIVGVYGMNFDNMPELRRQDGYFITLISMGLIAIGLWIYFKWKKYI
jgi:magnesium transporter